MPVLLGGEQVTKIRDYLAAKDQDGLNAYVVVLTLSGYRADDIEVAMRTMLAEMPHDVHAWWNGPCDLCPNPN